MATCEELRSELSLFAEQALRSVVREELERALSRSAQIVPAAPKVGEGLPKLGEALCERSTDPENHSWTRRHMRSFAAVVENEMARQMAKKRPAHLITTVKDPSGHGKKCEIEDQGRESKAAAGAAEGSVAVPPPAPAEILAPPPPPCTEPPNVVTAGGDDHLFSESIEAPLEVKTSDTTTHVRLSESMASTDALQSALATTTRTADLGSSSVAWSGEQLYYTGPTTTVEAFVLSMSFEYGVLSLIVLNAIAVGLEVQHTSTNLLSKEPVFFRIFEVVCGILFSLELFLRMYVYRCYLFSMPGWAWNVFDCVIVGLQIFEEILIVSDSSPDDFFLPRGTFMRIIRLFRIARILRILRVVHVLKELRVLVVSLLISMKAFAWAVVLLLMLVYIFGVYITQQTLDYRLSMHESKKTSDDADQALQESFGSLDRSILSLYKAASGGIDWGDLADPLIANISPIVGVVFVAYQAFIMLAMLNVVTAVFVDCALSRAKEEKEISMVSQAKSVFETVDEDGAGYISVDEFEKHIDTKEMISLFKEIDIAPAEARCLFEVLDMSGEGGIQLEEFVEGCVRLQGPARALDLCLVTRETRRMFDRYQRRGAAMEAHLERISSTRAAMETHLADISESLKRLVSDSRLAKEAPTDSFVGS
eukprot:gnl/TRDRNA2_/TRDRNA2_156413_c0_seq1.p1 gnl/TRDRNA2_/TRDRNA2_156413_c0~~gnl/TRDRNA2_/TRDRNA2_156413_c0_seq1.p1  ORF type:complete len:666 (+),score=123.65 gnl/TRDRNA2_/TRDRNA2_156413_c0_seq1:50-1999(+)